MGTFLVEADYESDLAAAGITSYETAMGFTGGRLVAAHRGRSVVRLEGALYLKRFIERPREARREVRAAELLISGPGPDPAPIAARGEGREGAFLVTASPEGAAPLIDALAGTTGRIRRGIVRSLGEAVRALHDRGLSFPDLMAQHVLVALPDRIFLIDAGRLGRRRGPGRRARDLAALELSMPYGIARAADRARFLRAYLGRRPLRAEPIVPAIRRAAARLDRRFRHRRDRLVASPAELAFLRGEGIRTFDDLMGHSGPGATRLRVVGGKENWRVELGGRVFFVKRHRPVEGSGPTPAAREWDAIHLLRRAGIRAMRPVAMGEDVEKGSTIWVERAPGEPLDDVLRRGDVDRRTRRQIAVEAADVLRRMRQREFHHRDMYLCHLFADPAAAPGERLTVIDLQRARSRPGLRERWYVKDVAALWYSAPRPPVTRTDAARFLRRYFAVERLGRAERSFARKVAAKAARIARCAKEPFERA